MLRRNILAKGEARSVNVADIPGTSVDADDSDSNPITAELSRIKRAWEIQVRELERQNELKEDIEKLQEDKARLEDDAHRVRERKNRLLLKEIVQLAQHERRRKDRNNVLLVGLAGAGKSSLVNTLSKALRGKFMRIAEAGSGNTQSHTVRISWYRTLGVSASELPAGSEIASILKDLPSLVDFCALRDDNTVELKTLLKLVLTGPYFTLDMETVTEAVTVTDDMRTLYRSGKEGEVQGKHFKNYRGGIGTIVFDKNTRGKKYYEVDVEFKIKEDLEDYELAFEIGICPFKDVDESHSVAKQKGAYAMKVVQCPKHGRVCLKCTTCGEESHHEEFSESGSGTKRDKKYGFCFDSESGSWTIVDEQERRIVSTISQIDLEESLRPVFGTYNPECIEAKLTLNTGMDIRRVPDVATDIGSRKDLSESSDSEDDQVVTQQHTDDNQAVCCHLSAIDTTATQSTSNEQEASIQHGKNSFITAAENLRKLLSLRDQEPDEDLKEALIHFLETEQREEAHIILEHVCEKIRQSDPENVVEIFPAFTEKCPSRPVIVILERGYSQGEETTYKGFDVYRRRYDFVSTESARIMTRPDMKEKIHSLADMDLTEASKLVESHSNITLINACPYRSRNHEVTEEVCIVLHCLVKGYVPFSEEPFPKMIGKFPVDVREGLCAFGMMPFPHHIPMEVDPPQIPPPGEGRDEFNPKLRLGTEIGQIQGNTSGTLGAFVELQDGSLGFLTCCHVVGEEGTKVSQPAGYAHAECGQVVMSAFDAGAPDRVGIDASIVKITDNNRIPTEGRFIRVPYQQLLYAGFRPDCPPKYDKGRFKNYFELRQDERDKVLLKVGNGTGLTRGVFYLNGVYGQQTSLPLQLPDGRNVQFFKQVEVLSVGVAEGSSSFFALGDSGALVFLRLNEELVCVGMAIGCTHYGSCLVTPIEHVLDRLGIRFVNFSNL